MQMSSSKNTQEHLRIFGMPPYLLGEIAEAVIKARLEGKEVVDLSQFNPNLGPPQRGVDALVQASLQPHNHRYSSSRGISKLREEFSARYKSKFDVELDPETEVCMTMGTKEGLAHLLSAVVSAGDSVIIPTPAYPVHRSSVFLAGANCTSVPICSGAMQEDSLVLSKDTEAFFERLTKTIKRSWPRPRVMILSFPHNPTSIVVTPCFFERLVELAKSESLMLIHDFSYAEICFDDYRAPSILSVPGAKEVAVEFYSLSKSFSIPGWRIGFCAGNRDLVSALIKIKSYLDFGLFQPLQIAAIEVLKDKDQKLEQNRLIYQKRRDLFIEGLKSCRWNIEKPLATPFIWANLPADCREDGSLNFAKELLAKSSVALCPGIGFDEQADDKVRIALVENERMMQKAIDGISNFLLGGLLFLSLPLELRADDCVEAASQISAGTKLEIGSEDEAAAYQKAIELCPKLSEAYYNLAINLTARKDFETAVVNFEKAIELSENNSLYSLGLAQAFFESKQLSKAEEVYAQVLEDNPQELVAYQGLAAVYDSLGRKDEAESMLQNAIKQNPNDASLYYNLAVLYEHSGEQQKALSNYQKAVDKKSNFAEAYLNLGKLFLNLGDLASAEPVLNKASFLVPKDAAVWLVLAQLKTSQGDLRAARDFLKKAEQLNPEDVNIISQQAVVLARLDEMQAAEDLLKKALKKFPEEPNVYSVYGWLSLRKQNLDEAERYLRKALSLNKSDAFTHNNLGVLFELKGLKQSARESFLKALELDPNLVEARENLRRLG